MKTNKTPSATPRHERQNVEAIQDDEVSYITQKLNVIKKEVEDTFKKVEKSREKLEEFLLEKQNSR